MQEPTRYFHVSYFFSQHQELKYAGWGEITFSCQGMFNRADILKEINSKGAVIGAVITGWQEMNEADYKRFLESKRNYGIER